MESIKKISKWLTLCSLVMTISSGIAKAQTFAEWFSQKKTQKKYLLQQIAALQVYSGYLKQGYNIATNGLGSISDYLKSEHGLHNTYYNRLKKADPVVKNNPMVKDIMDWQQGIIKSANEIKHAAGMTTSEHNYFASVRTAVLNDCDQQLNTLLNVVSDNKTEMNDAERLTMLKKIHSAMMSNYQFSLAFSAQVKIRGIGRQQEQAQSQALKKMYGIN